MGDLISREAAAQILMEKSYSYVVSLFPTSNECKTAREIAKECAEAVRQMEAVDAEPVRHGMWIERDGKTWCNLCCKPNKAYMPPFCPHCGAKMDGGADG